VVTVTIAITIMALTTAINWLVEANDSTLVATVAGASVGDEYTSDRWFAGVVGTALSVVADNWVESFACSAHACIKRGTRISVVAGHGVVDMRAP